VGISVPAVQFQRTAEYEDCLFMPVKVRECDALVIPCFGKCRSDPDCLFTGSERFPKFLQFIECNRLVKCCLCVRGIGFERTVKRDDSLLISLQRKECDPFLVMNASMRKTKGDILVKRNNCLFKLFKTREGEAFFFEGVGIFWVEPETSGKCFYRICILPQRDKREPFLV